MGGEKPRNYTEWGKTPGRSCTDLGASGRTGSKVDPVYESGMWGEFRVGYSAYNPMTGYPPHASDAADLKAHEGVG